jgi:hypothetical protein
VAEADLVVAHHPINRPAGRAAAEAVKQVLAWRDDEAGGSVVVERAAAGVILTLFCQRNAGRLDQADQLHVGLDPFQLCFRYARHPFPL